ncbi:MAG: KEOPS complex N(6)-L-threonylcarbamoyladenine synthase Kae1, partial [Candidatus Diapherotrites archaeon]
MICLGIESTAHTCGIGIMNEKGEVLANERKSFTTEEGGMIPRELAEHHVEKFPEILKNAFEKAKLSWKDIDCVSYSAGPGMGPALSTGATLARMLSLLHNKPLVAVNHCVAHIEIGKEKTGCKDPLVLYVSGGNSQIIGYETGKYRVYGETLDIGVGNLLDSFGRAMGLGFPAGPVIDKMYFEAKNYIELPYSVKGMDLNFSGLLTNAKQKIGKENETDLAYSLMHTCFAMLTEVTERALAHTEKKEVLLVGGVAASKALQKMIGEMCEDRKVKMFVCPVP